MAQHVTSADGTRIVFDRYGSGPPLIVVAGILCDRERTRPLAERLAERFTVINYDRRGRGASGDIAPYAVRREVEDIAALISHVGFTSSVYGHSSGAGLALNAAASGLPITRLVLHEPPYGGDDEESQHEARQLAETVRTAITEGRHADAIKHFLTASGLPPEMAEWGAADPGAQSMAPTMLNDFEVIGDFTGGTIPEDLVRAITVPTLVIAGDASPDFFLETATRMARLLPNGQYTLLEGADHGAPPDLVAPAVEAFITSRASTN